MKAASLFAHDKWHPVMNGTQRMTRSDAWHAVMNGTSHDRHSACTVMQALSTHSDA